MTVAVVVSARAYRLVFVPSATHFVATSISHTFSLCFHGSVSCIQPSADAPVGFSVVIAASAPVDNGGLVHAVTVIQPVQTWTVIRGQDDFLAVATSLAPGLPGLPLCPDASVDGRDINSIVAARNALQAWLTSILMYPGAIQSVSVNNFLAYNANMIPPQYENVPWTIFTANGQVASPAPTSENQQSTSEQEQQVLSLQSQPQSPQQQASGQHTSSTCASPDDNFNSHLDDMMMDDMFDGGDEIGPSLQPEDSDDEEEYRASIRYRATDEPITEEDEMDIAIAIAGEVEMIEDVGSLAQSLGASHLGRSLMLQEEIAGHRQPQQLYRQPQPQVGLQMGIAVSGASSGGIGSAMERAPPGLGGSFNQTKPESPPRLDAFKMVKVIGKGSFGT